MGGEIVAVLYSFFMLDDDNFFLTAGESLIPLFNDAMLIVLCVYFLSSSFSAEIRLALRLSFYFLRLWIWITRASLFSSLVSS
jgi:hypothetical protein